MPSRVNYSFSRLPFESRGQRIALMPHVFIYRIPVATIACSSTEYEIGQVMLCVNPCTVQNVNTIVYYHINTHGTKYHFWGVEIWKPLFSVIFLWKPKNRFPIFHTPKLTIVYPSFPVIYPYVMPQKTWSCWKNAFNFATTNKKGFWLCGYIALHYVHFTFTFIHLHVHLITLIELDTCNHASCITHHGVIRHVLWFRLPVEDAVLATLWADRAVATILDFLRHSVVEFQLSLFSIGVALRRRSLWRAGREHFLDKLHSGNNCDSNQLRMKPCGLGLGRCHNWNIPSECMLMCSQFAKRLGWLWTQGSNGEASRLCFDPAVLCLGIPSAPSGHKKSAALVSWWSTLLCSVDTTKWDWWTSRLGYLLPDLVFTIGIVAEMPEIQTLLPSQSPSPRQNADGRASVGG